MHEAKRIFLAKDLKNQFLLWNPIGAYVPDDEYDDLIQEIDLFCEKQRSMQEVYEFIHKYLHSYMGLEEITLENIRENINLQLE